MKPDPVIRYAPEHALADELPQLVTAPPNSGGIDLRAVLWDSPGIATRTRIRALLCVSAVAACATALGHGASAAGPLHISLKFPKACTGAVYRITLKPTGSATSVTVKNAAAGNALPAEIRAVAAITKAGASVHVYVFMNNLAVRKLSAVTAQPDALELIVAAAFDYSPKQDVRIQVGSVAVDKITTLNNVERVIRWYSLGNFTSPAPAVAKFSAAPASDASAHCG